MSRFNRLICGAGFGFLRATFQSIGSGRGVTTDTYGHLLPLKAIVGLTAAERHPVRGLSLANSPRLTRCDAFLHEPILREGDDAAYREIAKQQRRLPA